MRENRGKKNKDLRDLERLLAQMANNASAGDIANFCLAMIHGSPEPWHTVQRLMPELRKIEKPARRPTTMSDMNEARFLRILNGAD